jgi:hypothetical protein
MDIRKYLFYYALGLATGGLFTAGWLKRHYYYARRSEHTYPDVQPIKGVNK